MFGFAPSMAVPAAVAPRQPAAWDTDDPELNAWADVHLDEFAKAKLLGATAELRKKAIFITRSRFLAGTINNPSPYVGGIIRREAESNPYGTAGRTSSAMQLPGPSMHGPPISPQAVASPMHGAHRPQMQPPPCIPVAGALPPAWVTAALKVHGSRSSMFRVVASNVPSAGFEAISSLPSTFQTACILSMLLAPQNYSNAEAYMKWFAESARTAIPSGLGSVSGSSTTANSAKKVAALIFGSISGAEWVGLGMACQHLAENDMHVQIVERCSINQPSRWQAVLDEVGQHLNPPAPYTCVSPADALQFIQQKGAQWQTHGVSVLALVVAPSPVTSPAAPGASMPGYHASPASDFWVHVAALTALKKFCSSVLVGHMHGQAFEFGEVAAYLNKLFGEPWTMNPSHLRVPQPPWTVRCRPAEARALDQAPRAMTKTPACESWHRDLQAMFATQAPFSLVLPSLSELDELMEKQAEGQQLSVDEQKKLAWVMEASVAGAVAAGGGAQKLLSRAALVAVFGLDGWALSEHWDKKMPCAGLINAVTGIPVAEGNPEAIRCGHGRWCSSCSELYDSLVSCPSPHLIAEIAKRLLKDGLCPEAGASLTPSITSIALPEHVCGHPCNGLVA
ncbi:MAG TPA: hypothetical protein VLA31_04375 [Burkholderiaceae bacterium]|nr:hypothetical protein [Burkholderiaceae bacterium]